MTILLLHFTPLFLGQYLFNHLFLKYNKIKLNKVKQKPHIADGQGTPREG